MVNEMEVLLKNCEIIPDVLKAAPRQFIKVTYRNGLAVNQGAELTPTQVQFQPTVEWEVEPHSYYTLIMTDPDATSRKKPTFREVNHWLVVNVPGNELTKGDEIRAYVGAGPPKDTGLHRYVFVVYKQPGILEFKETRAGSKSLVGRPLFRTTEFAAKYGLGDPVGINFFEAQYDEFVDTQQKQISTWEKVRVGAYVSTELLARKIGLR